MKLFQRKGQIGIPTFVGYFLIVVVTASLVQEAFLYKRKLVTLQKYPGFEDICKGLPEEINTYLPVKDYCEYVKSRTHIIVLKVIFLLGLVYFMQEQDPPAYDVQLPPKYLTPPSYHSGFTPTAPELEWDEYAPQILGVPPNDPYAGVMDELGMYKDPQGKMHKRKMY